MISIVSHCLGTDEEAIIYLVSTRSNTQRHEIFKLYKTLFGRVGSFNQIAQKFNISQILQIEVIYLPSCAII